MTDQPYVSGSVAANPSTVLVPPSQRHTEDEQFLAAVRAKLQLQPEFYVDPTENEFTRCCPGIVCTCTRD